MQNNNETNENVNKVVAEFFKKKPLQKNNNRRRPPYHQVTQKQNHEENARETPAHSNAAFENHDSSENHKNNYNKQHRNFKKNNKKGGKPYYDKNRQNLKDESASVGNADEPQAVNTAEETVSDNLENFNDAPQKIETETETSAEMITNGSTEPSHESTENSDSEWYDPEVLVEIIGVRFKAGGKIYYFAPNGVTASKGDNIIVETARGLEFGTVQTPNTTVKIRDVVMPLKNVVRIATEEDICKHNENQSKVVEAMRICNEKIAFHKLDMKLVDVEYTFDNSKLLFYFTSDGRVDFRELVKDLAGVFKTRIELRQIGIREETKLLGGIGICGLPFCCKSFLNDFVQVSIKMAKEQGLSLNSAKISGACGRLMCCLRYEYDTYDDEIRRTPKVDTKVITPDGPGVVCDTQPLAGLCKVKFVSNDETVIKVYHRDDLKRADSGDANQ